MFLVKERRAGHYGTKLSESEQYLWHFIETHILEIPDYSIVKLSERANVSTATIVRTMKKGYEGFTSFKHHLKDKENQNINFSALEKVDRGIRTAILKNEEEVTRTINMIEIGNIEDAIQKSRLLDGLLSLLEVFRINCSGNDG